MESTRTKIRLPLPFLLLFLSLSDLSAAILSALSVDWREEP